MFFHAEWELQDKFIAGTTIGANYRCTNNPNFLKIRDEFKQEISQLCQKNVNPYYLQQIHSNIVIDAKTHNINQAGDAFFAQYEDELATVLTADCVPIVLGSEDGKEWAAIHAGWKGLHNGIIPSTVKRFSGKIHAWIGPHIRQDNYQVDKEFYKRFLDLNSDYKSAFIKENEEKYRADLSMIAHHQLVNCGVKSISDSKICTFSDKRFDSFRRDGKDMGNALTFIISR